MCQVTKRRETFGDLLLMFGSMPTTGGQAWGTEEKPMPEDPLLFLPPNEDQGPEENKE